MTPRLWIHLAARVDNHVARRYRGEQRLGLARRFLTEVEAVLGLALTHPEVDPVFVPEIPGVRRGLLRRVPQALVYEIGLRTSDAQAVLTRYDLRQKQAPDWQAPRQAA